MASFPQVRRILRMHSAHRTVGVSGLASAFRPCCWTEPLLAAEPPATSFAWVLPTDALRLLRTHLSHLRYALIALAPMPDFFRFLRFALSTAVPRQPHRH